MCVGPHLPPLHLKLWNLPPLPGYFFHPQIYYHGEPISVNVHVTNNTNKTVKKIKISGTQAEGQSRGWARGLLPGVGGSRRLSLC